jgi:hypothetical protein
MPRPNVFLLGVDDDIDEGTNNLAMDIASSLHVYYYYLLLLLFHQIPTHARVIVSHVLFHYIAQVLNNYQIPILFDPPSDNGTFHTIGISCRGLYGSIDKSMYALSMI